MGITSTYKEINYKELADDLITQCANYLYRIVELKEEVEKAKNQVGRNIDELVDFWQAEKEQWEKQNTLLAVNAIAYTLNKIGYEGNLSANNFFQLYLRDEIPNLK